MTTIAMTTMYLTSLQLRKYVPIIIVQSVLPVQIYCGNCIVKQQTFVGRVFANAESLFYYAKEGRPNRRTLSQQEIQSLLAQAQAAMATEVTAGERSHDRGNKERLHNIHQVDMDSSRDLQSQINLKSATPNVHEIYNCVEGETGEVLNTSTIESVQSINSETSLSSSYPITSLSSFQTTPLSSSWSVSGSAGEVSSLLCSADGAVEGLTPPGGRKSVRFQDDKVIKLMYV